MWKINNKLVKFLICYFVLIGVVTLMYTVISIITPKFDFENAIKAVLIGFIPVALMNALWWKKGIDKVELWVKRIYYCIISTGFISFCLIMFKKNFDWTLFAIAFGAGLAVTLLIGLPLWIIADRREKAKLEEINRKLQDNQKDEE